METGSPGDAGSSSLPSPTVRTFLIADVRGYTRFTSEHGDEAAAGLADRFASLCERMVGDYDGQVIELRGDEALCVFLSARDALRGAVALRGAFKEAVADVVNPIFRLFRAFDDEGSSACRTTEAGYGVRELDAYFCGTVEIED